MHLCLYLVLSKRLPTYSLLLLQQIIKNDISFTIDRSIQNPRDTQGRISLNEVVLLMEVEQKDRCVDYDM